MTLTKSRGRPPPGNEAARRSRRGEARLNISSNSSARENNQRAEPINLDDLRFARQVERLHRLGLRLLFEMLAKIGNRVAEQQVRVMNATRARADTGQ
jgi:hypothetical protein